MAQATTLKGNAKIDDIAAIKKLLVLALLRSGASQGEVASALGVDQSQVSRLFPGGLNLKKKK